MKNIGEEIVRVRKEVDVIIANWTIVLASIAGISLLVGGIGIFSLMQIAISERLFEIGLRKATGATDGAIFLQFLIESVSLSVVGGALGVILGSGITILAGQAFEDGLQHLAARSWAFRGVRDHHRPLRGTLSGPAGQSADPGGGDSRRLAPRLVSGRAVSEPRPPGKGFPQPPRFHGGRAIRSARARARLMDGSSITSLPRARPSSAICFVPEARAIRTRVATMSLDPGKSSSAIFAMCLSLIAPKTRTCGVFVASRWRARAWAPAGLCAPSRRKGGRPGKRSRRPGHEARFMAATPRLRSSFSPESERDSSVRIATIRFVRWCAPGSGFHAHVEMTRCSHPQPCADLGQRGSLEGPDQPRTLDASDPSDGPFSLFRHRSDHGQPASAQHPRLLAGNGEEGAAKVLLVVEIDGHDRGNEGTSHVRGIEPPAQPDFQDRQIDGAVLEIQERNRGQDLEVVRVSLDLAFSPQVFGGVTNAQNQTFELGVPDIPAGNGDPLTNIHEMG